MTLRRQRTAQIVLLVVIGGLAVGATSTLLGLDLRALVAAADPQQRLGTITTEEAEQRAIAQLAVQDPSLVGIVLRGTERADGLVDALDATGNIVQHFDEPKDAYVIDFEADRTDEFSNVSGVVVVDAKTGEILTSAILKNNEP